MTSSGALVAPFTNTNVSPGRLSRSSRARSFEEAPEQWQPILHASNQVVLYNPHSHALSIALTTNEAARGVVVTRRPRLEGTDIHTRDTCPYCKQALPPGFSHDADDDHDERWEDVDEVVEDVSTDPAYHSRASDYFRLLQVANETSSNASSRRQSLSPAFRVGGSGDNEERRREMEENRSTEGAFPAEKMAEGYFKMFFQEECKLGMGANGTVYLCQHVLDGNPLGHFAVKKIAVGESHSYLLKILREVRLLERLHHPNIISYHHAWLENAQFSSFGPKVPTLHVLMQWAEGGSLDDFIDVRLGRKTAHIHMHPMLNSQSTFDPIIPETGSPGPSVASEQTTPTPKPKNMRFASAGSGLDVQDQEPAQHGASHSRSARIRAFRAYQRAPPEEKDRMRREMENNFGTAFPPGGASGGNSRSAKEWTAVHLLSAEEVKSLFHDVSEGLAFLHDKSILHLDLKPGNVLLTWDEGRLIPRAMLSDFGTSRDMINSSRTQRSGNTGTLEYIAPEALPSPQTGLLQQVDSKADMWSLGMILHKLLFFKLPYRYAAEGDANGEPISRNEEGEKMTRLEKEVQDYPGFKANSTHITTFEARRIPHAFLVLLENLLHKSPSSRPSCERVNAAIRNGKLDPLVGPLTSENLNMSLAPRPRRESDPQPEPHVEDEAPTTVINEIPRMLELPSSVDILGVEQNLWRRWLTWTAWTSLLFSNAPAPVAVGRKSSRGASSSPTHRQWLVLGLKTLRSGLLVVKVATLGWLCPEPLTRPRGWVVAVLLTLAVVDTVREHEDELDLRRRPGNEKQSPSSSRLLSRGGWRSVYVTVGLAALHFGVVGFSVSSLGQAYAGPWWRGACCVQT